MGLPGQGKDGVSDTRSKGAGPDKAIQQKKPYMDISIRVKEEISEVMHCVSGGTAGVSKTTPYGGSARHRVLASWTFMGLRRQGRGGVSQKAGYVGGARQKSQKPLPLWAAPDAELQPAGHIWVYIGGEKKSIRNHTLSRPSKRSSRRYAKYGCV